MRRVGDYYRYLAEFSTGDTRSKAASASMEGYQAASEVAEKVCFCGQRCADARRGQE